LKGAGPQFAKVTPMPSRHDAANDRKSENNLTQLVLVQECFRHFDLNNVGANNVHLSLFEMPGAFVFGPNGKVDTVQRNWALATSVLGIDQNRIWVSYFKAGEVLGWYVSEDYGHAISLDSCRSASKPDHWT
jgi:alanyl-tRNA synthetase